MKNLSSQINESIKEELNNINKRIKGIILLETLKDKIIDRLNKDILNFSFENIEDKVEETTIEDDSNTMHTRLIFCKSQVVNLNSKSNNDILLICINEVLNIRL